MALRASNVNAANNPKTKKTVEQTFTKLSQLQHILLRPDTYIGSVERVQEDVWTWCDEESHMVSKEITYAPGLYKIFDEILVNAADHKHRDPSMTTLKVDIDEENQMISVWNNGAGIPVEMHKKEKIFVPELIFGHLLTSSNYDDDEKKVVGGRNGYGAKLANIFSKEFVVHTADAERGKRYRQVFRNNMTEKDQPEILSNAKGESFTKISFSPDLERFGMACFDSDIVSLLKKRVYDVAGINSSLRVFLNGKRLPIRSFKDYVNLFTASENSQPIHYEKLNDRWEVAVTASDGQFSQVSFVNSIWTMKGGTHVTHVSDQIVAKISEHIAKKDKGLKVKPFHIKGYLSLYINCLIENPAFDSQTKETLTTKPSKFGSKWNFSDDLAKKVIKSGIIEKILAFALFKQSNELSKTDGGKKARLTGIAKLDDANKAGTREASKCSLILTEGDSAKTLAISGLSVVGRDYYGVFPLRGKLLNVREAKHKQIMDNDEISNLKKILGLQHNKKYSAETLKSLRYGHVLIMADQDHDGSHIKGLVINFFDHFWPSLLQVDGFLQEFTTPIVKCTKGKNEKVFFTIPEYKRWIGNDVKGAKAWKSRYYKGLGTSTPAEAREYFSNLPLHLHTFHHRGTDCNDMIELAFSKQRVNDRKNWLSSYAPGTFLNHETDELSYSNFVNKELILFSIADNARSIPSVIDGLKPSQRKILFGCFKRKLYKTEIKVGQLAGYVEEHTAYHHGPASLHSTVVGLAQNFVGSNNVNLLVPAGQFGTRLQGGKDAASSRYIFTKLAPICRALFPELDDPVLSYLEDDGMSIEPSWYCPVIPTILVNGADGIGTGWSSSVPCYNPVELIANIRRLLNDEPLDPMIPWYRGFRGTIVPVTNAKSFDVYGSLRADPSLNSFLIDELPIRSWTTPYKEFLESRIIGPSDAKPPVIKEFRDNSTENRVCFSITTDQDNAAILSTPEAYKQLKLVSSLSVNNMVLFDEEGRIRKYEHPEEIMHEFFRVRYDLYVKRRAYLLNELEQELLCLDNKKRFILMVIDGKLKVAKRKKLELLTDLKRLNFLPIPKKTNGHTVVDPEDPVEENNEGSGSTTDYDYLLSMPLWSLTAERVQQLKDQREQKLHEKGEMEGMSAKCLWEKDLDNLERALEKDEKEAAKQAADLDRSAKQARARQGHGRKRGKAVSNVARVCSSPEDLMKISPPSARVVQPKKSRNKKVHRETKADDNVTISISDSELEDAIIDHADSNAGRRINRSSEDRKTVKSPSEKASSDESEDDNDTMSLSQRLAQRLKVSRTCKNSPSQSAGVSEVKKSVTKRPRATKTKSSRTASKVVTVSPTKSPNPKKCRVKGPAISKKKKKSILTKDSLVDDLSDDVENDEPTEPIAVSRPRRQRTVKRIVIQESDGDDDDGDSVFSVSDDDDSDY